MSKKGERPVQDPDDEECIQRQRQRLGDILQASGETIIKDQDDVITTETGVIVLHKPGETIEEYGARCDAASPPFSAEQKRVIRAAAREYWDAIDE